MYAPYDVQYPWYSISCSRKPDWAAHTTVSVVIRGGEVARAHTLRDGSNDCDLCEKLRDIW